MKIVADENIPLVDHYFGSSGELILKSGRLIARDDILDADVLLVRSVTRVDASLLHNTRVRWVGSVTAGADHLDTAYMDQQGIGWSVASGCNAIAVADYVLSVVAALQKKGLLKEHSLRAGVVGVGHVGRLVVDRLKTLGFDVLQCDPLRAASEPHFTHTPLADFHALDIILLHTPLTHEGEHPTFHMIDQAFLERQQAGCVLLNAGRGEVISFSGLKLFGTHLCWCFDVWEGEPVIDQDVLSLATIATPHIAGYSIQAKYRAIEMIYRAAYFSLSLHDVSIVSCPQGVLKGVGSDWREAVLQCFNPLQVTEEMKTQLLSGQKTFDELRKSFPDRDEFSEFAGWIKR